MLTDEQVAALGDGKKAFPVQLSVNGTALRLRVARMGGMNLIGMSRAVRDQAGVAIGSSYQLEIRIDDEQRTIEIPDDLAEALAAETATEAAFRALSYTHRKEFVRWVTEAKKPATRTARISTAVDMIRAGRTR